MPGKPANLPYGVDELPSKAVIAANAVQYVAVLASFLSYPLIVTREAHASPQVTSSVLSWSLIVLAIGTSLQALPNRFIGSGYLAPCTMAAVFISPSIEAARLGGLARVAGMTMFSGAAEPLLSRSLHRVRSLLHRNWPVSSCFLWR